MSEEQNCNVAKPKRRFLLGKLFLVVTPVDAETKEEALDKYNNCRGKPIQECIPDSDVKETTKYLQPFVRDQDEFPADRSDEMRAFVAIGKQLSHLDRDGNQAEPIVAPKHQSSVILGPNGKIARNIIDRPFGK